MRTFADVCMVERWVGGGEASLRPQLRDFGKLYRHQFSTTDFQT